MSESIKKCHPTMIDELFARFDGGSAEKMIKPLMRDSSGEIDWVAQFDMGA